MSEKTKAQLASLQEEVALLRKELQMHVSAPVITGGFSFEIRTPCKEPDPDYHSAEALQELMQRMEDRSVTYAELRKIFADDLDTLVGWLNSFTYIGAWNGCTLDQDKIPVYHWVWDGIFEKRGEEMWYTGGGASASGYGHAELLVEDDNLIVLF